MFIISEKINTSKTIKEKKTNEYVNEMHEFLKMYWIVSIENNFKQFLVSISQTSAENW